MDMEPMKNCYRQMQSTEKFMNPRRKEMRTNGKEENKHMESM